MASTSNVTLPVRALGATVGVQLWLDTRALAGAAVAARDNSPRVLAAKVSMGGCKLKSLLAARQRRPPRQLNGETYGMRLARQCMWFRGASPLSCWRVPARTMATMGGGQ